VSQQTRASQEYACALDEVLIDQEINVKNAQEELL
jgi:hypothetical protein